MKAKLVKGPYYSVFFDGVGHSRIIEHDPVVDFLSDDYIEAMSKLPEQFDCSTDCLICPGRYTCTLSPDFVEPYPCPGILEDLV